MKVAVFDTRSYDREALESANASFGLELTFLEPRLNERTALLAAGHEVVCSFVNDSVDEASLRVLRDVGVRLIALRSAGFNHVDLAAAEHLELPVVRVPEYSPYAVAEHAVALAMALNRKIHRANARVREWDFSLEGLVGFDLHGKTVGVMGTGRIGRVAARIFHGFGCRILAHDAHPSPALIADVGAEYVPPMDLCRKSDLITLHLPLTPLTRHLIDAKVLSTMKPGVMIINTSRGALIDSKALIAALKRGQVGAAGLDVYEEEEGVFFKDLSDKILQDDVLARLLTFPNVLITAHQAFLTKEALDAIARTTLQNIDAYANGRPLENAVRVEDIHGGLGRETLH